MEHTALRCEKTGEEFEQHESRRLDRDDEALEDDDDQIADDQHEHRQGGVVRGAHQRGDGRRQPGVRKREGANARERKCVDQKSTAPAVASAKPGGQMNPLTNPR